MSHAPSRSASSRSARPGIANVPSRRPSSHTPHAADRCGAAAAAASGLSSAGGRRRRPATSSPAARRAGSAMRRARRRRACRRDRHDGAGRRGSAGGPSRTASRTAPIRRSRRRTRRRTTPPSEATSGAALRASVNPPSSSNHAGICGCRAATTAPDRGPRGQRDLEHGLDDVAVEHAGPRLGAGPRHVDADRAEPDRRGDRQVVVPAGRLVDVEIETAPSAGAEGSTGAVVSHRRAAGSTARRCRCAAARPGCR